MPLCPNCNQWYEVSRGVSGCPACAAGGRTEGHPSLDPEHDVVALARFRNWAEAGFFEDMLHRHGIAAELQPREQYDAVGGHWGHQLMLCVPAADFDRALALVERELDENVEDERSDAPRLADEVFASHRPRAGVDDVGGGGSPLEGPPLWKPLAVVLVAGGLAYLGTHGLRWARPGPAAALDGRPASNASDLWRYLAGEGGVWQRELGPNGARTRMWHEPRSGTLHIEEDRDGDGHFERRLQFQGDRRIEQQRVDPAPAAPDG